MPALFGIGVTLALERDMGLMRLKRAQPAPPAAWLVAKIACGVVLGVLAYRPSSSLAAAHRQTRAWPPARWSALSAALIVGHDSVLRHGAHDRLAGRAASAAPGYANLIYLPGCYLSGMFFPLPQSMYWQAPIWPQFHVEQFAMHARRHHEVPVRAGAVGDRPRMLGFTVLFSAASPSGAWRARAKRGPAQSRNACQREPCPAFASKSGMSPLWLPLYNDGGRR